MKDIIALYSPRPGIGKSTVAQHLANRWGYTVMSFATPLKLMAHVLLSQLGYSCEGIQRMLYGEDKELIIPELKTTPRHIMRALGTEFGRQCIHPDLWIKIADVQMQQALLQGAIGIVFDDLRFSNEAAFLRSQDAELWLIDGPARTTSDASHVSDGSLNAGFTFDHTILNDSSLVDLYSRVDSVLQLAAA